MVAREVKQPKTILERPPQGGLFASSAVFMFPLHLSAASPLTYNCNQTAEEHTRFSVFCVSP